ncbi:MAG: C-GCAxxG-C-C family protein [Thermoleophilia bacterium]|nr:C-GCAxxG-C-C family protein [Thermoleophilia bacterium]
MVAITRREGAAAFLRTGYCSQTLFRTIDRAYGVPLNDEERASVPLAGGIMGQGYQCGMVWGSTLAAGAQAYRLYGSGPRAQIRAIAAAQRIVESFRTQNGSIECREIVGIDLLSASTIQAAGYILRGGPLRCFRMAARYPAVGLSEIEAAMSEEGSEAGAAVCDGAAAFDGAAADVPVGGAALLATKLGASDLHTVVASGLAGGIGLSGSACGALGAAIWLAGVRSLAEGAEKVPYKPESGQALLERFLECTGGEVKCSKIVGRMFDGVADHAAFIRAGGCAGVIDTLAECDSGGAASPKPAVRGEER